MPFVKRHISVHRIPSRVRDDRERPFGGQDGGAYNFDLGNSRTEIFLQNGLDSGIPDLLVGQHRMFFGEFEHRIQRVTNTRRGVAINHWKP